MPSSVTPGRKTKKSKLAALLRFDRQLHQSVSQGVSSFSHLVGLDEVGRGSLIGSVVGGAVCLPTRLSREQRQLLTWLDDSKKLKASLRAELAEAIHNFCAVGIGEASKEEVDQLNIHYASLLALHRAFYALCEVKKLSPEGPECFLIMDGRAIIPDFRADRQKAIIKGDGQSAAIAGASVVAKHYRDSMIQQLAVQYPGYDWDRNMGYATPAHLQGIQTLGLTPLHRTNFCKAYTQLPLPL